MHIIAKFYVEVAGVAPSCMSVRPSMIAAVAVWFARSFEEYTLLRERTWVSVLLYFRCILNCFTNFISSIFVMHIDSRKTFKTWPDSSSTECGALREAWQASPYNQTAALSCTPSTAALAAEPLGGWVPFANGFRKGARPPSRHQRKSCTDLIHFMFLDIHTLLFVDWACRSLWSLAAAYRTEMPPSGPYPPLERRIASSKRHHPNKAQDKKKSLKTRLIATTPNGKWQSGQRLQARSTQKIPAVALFIPGQLR